MHNTHFKSLFKYCQHNVRKKPVNVYYSILINQMCKKYIITHSFYCFIKYIADESPITLDYTVTTIFTDRVIKILDFCVVTST